MIHPPQPQPQPQQTRTLHSCTHIHEELVCLLWLGINLAEKLQLVGLMGMCGSARALVLSHVTASSLEVIQVATGCVCSTLQPHSTAIDDVVWVADRVVAACSADKLMLHAFALSSAGHLTCSMCKATELQRLQCMQPISIGSDCAMVSSQWCGSGRLFITGRDGCC